MSKQQTYHEKKTKKSASKKVEGIKKQIKNGYIK